MKTKDKLNTAIGDIGPNANSHVISKELEILCGLKSDYPIKHKRSILLDSDFRLSKYKRIPQILKAVNLPFYFYFLENSQFYVPLNIKFIYTNINISNINY